MHKGQIARELRRTPAAGRQRIRRRQGGRKCYVIRTPDGQYPMVDAGIGRLLIASLHQGIADIIPARLPFYENWLTPPGLRDGKFGLAPLHAVLSFLRLEGRASYE